MDDIAVGLTGERQGIELRSLRCRPLAGGLRQFFWRKRAKSDGGRVSSGVREMVNEQKRRRRLAFWGGFFVLAVIGSLWAGLSKDPRGPGFFNDAGFEAEPAFVEADFVEAPPEFATTTVMPSTTAVPTTGFEGSTTRAPTTTALSTTTGPPTTASTTAGSETSEAEATTTESAG